MPTKTTVYEVEFTQDDLGSVFDMLRYDHARVRKSEINMKDDDLGRTRHKLELEAANPAFKRWASFGLTPREVS